MLTLVFGVTPCWLVSQDGLLEVSSVGDGLAATSCCHNLSEATIFHLSLSGVPVQEVRVLNEAMLII